MDHKHKHLIVNHLLDLAALAASYNFEHFLIDHGGSRQTFLHDLSHSKLLFSLSLLFKESLLLESFFFVDSLHLNVSLRLLLLLVGHHVSFKSHNLVLFDPITSILRGWQVAQRRHDVDSGLRGLPTVGRGVATCNRRFFPSFTIGLLLVEPHLVSQRGRHLCYSRYRSRMFWPLWSRHLKLTFLDGLGCGALGEHRGLNIGQFLIQLRVLSTYERSLALTERQCVLRTLEDTFRDQWRGCLVCATHGSQNFALRVLTKEDLRSLLTFALWHGERGAIGT